MTTAHEQPTTLRAFPLLSYLQSPHHDLLVGDLDERDGVLVAEGFAHVQSLGVSHCMALGVLDEYLKGPSGTFLNRAHRFDLYFPLSECKTFV